MTNGESAIGLASLAFDFGDEECDDLVQQGRAALVDFQWQ
jgi:hypothetical protein